MVQPPPELVRGMDYTIRPIGRICASTGVALEPGTTCRSALVERNGRLERLDFLLTAWKEAPEGTIGHWRSRVPASTAAQTKRIEPDELMQQFERLEDSGHIQIRRLRYVLALMLLQKKRMELEGTRSDDGIEYLLLVGTKGEGPFEVRDEQLGPEEIAAIQRELATAEIEQRIPTVVE